MMEKREHTSLFLLDEFLSRMIPELDEAVVTAIILHGSYARGEAFPPYSDIDLVRIVQETTDYGKKKAFSIAMGTC